MLLDYLLLLIITAFLIIAVIKIKLKKKPFHLRKLPHVAFRNVINSMDIINKVIDLASTSTRFRQRLRQANRKIFNLIIECYEKFSYEDEELHCYRRILVLETERHELQGSEQVALLVLWNSQDLINLLTILNGSFSIDHVELAIDRDQLYGEFQSAWGHPLFRKCHFVKVLGQNSYFDSEDMEFILKNFDLKYGFSNHCLQQVGDDLEVVDCSKGRDIERSDGLLATILIESRSMYFLIWHDRFPMDQQTLFHFSEN
nr:protein W10D9.2 [imported] - Caenorhabditis elegans [Caenorhabditis elegans]